MSAQSPFRRWFERQLVKHISPNPCHCSNIRDVELRWWLAHPLFYFRAWWYERSGHPGKYPPNYLG